MLLQRVSVEQRCCQNPDANIGFPNDAYIIIYLYMHSIFVWYWSNYANLVWQVPILSFLYNFKCCAQVDMSLYHDKAAGSVFGPFLSTEFQT